MVGAPDEPRPSGWDERRDRISAEYEATAIRLFAERGFKNVTVDDVADELGVSARTLFRYFPSKDDLLLARPRRRQAETNAALLAIGDTDDVVGAIWSTFIRLADIHTADLPGLLLWQRAVSGARHILARVAGESTIESGSILADLCARSLGVDPRTDVRAHAVAAAIHGADAAVLRFWYQRKGGDDLVELYRQAFAAVQAAVDRAATTAG